MFSPKCTTQVTGRKHEVIKKPLVLLQLYFCNVLITDAELFREAFDESLVDAVRRACYFQPIVLKTLWL